MYRMLTLSYTSAPHAEAAKLQCSGMFPYSRIENPPLSKTSSEYPYLNRCAARVCCKSACHWLTTVPCSNSAQITGVVNG